MEAGCGALLLQRVPVVWRWVESMYSQSSSSGRLTLCHRACVPVLSAGVPLCLRISILLSDQIGLLMRKGALEPDGHRLQAVPLG